MKASKSKIRFDMKKGVIGVILAVLALLMYGGLSPSQWGIGSVFCVLFLLVGFVRINAGTNTKKWVWNILWGAAMLWVTWQVCPRVVNSAQYIFIDTKNQILNFLCILTVCGLLFLLTTRWKMSFIIASFILVLLASANGFIYQFRGKELAPVDILSVRTALNVAGQYTPVLNADMLYGWCTWLLVLFFGFSIPKQPRLPRWRGRLFAVLVEIVVIFSLWTCSAKIPTKLWDNEGTRINGYYLNFLLELRDSIVEKPQNYDPKTIAECAQNYIDADGDKPLESLPNVIVIMDESYADFRILGRELRTSQPVTPFLDSLEENTIRGYALTSVYGGNTANAELEFLTGHSMAFLPANVVPHQQYIHGEIYTLAWLMNAYGYRSVATHPYYANGWSRNTVYPYFGFAETIFLDQYPKEHLIRNYVSDQEMFTSVLQTLEDDTRQAPLFLFGITMQNHGGYEYDGDDFQQTIRLEGYKGDYPKAEQYLSLIHETDAAVEELINAIKDYPEDTVVLFFGDHFPGIESKFYEELHGGKYDKLSEKMLKYQVPFFIWANYDLPEEIVDCTSVSYLSRYLLDAAGIPLPPYYQFLADVEKVIPAINARGYYSMDKNTFIDCANAKGEEAKWLNRYASIQYNNFFDAHNRNPVFFQKYIASGED